MRPRIPEGFFIWRRKMEDRIIRGELIHPHFGLIINDTIVNQFGIITGAVLSFLIKKDHTNLRSEQNSTELFHVPMKDIGKYLGLSPHVTRKALKELIEEDIIFMTRAGIPPKTLFSINYQFIYATLIEEGPYL